MQTPFTWRHITTRPRGLSKDATTGIVFLVFRLQVVAALWTSSTGVWQRKGTGVQKWGQNSWCPWRANYFWVSLFPSSTPPGPLKPKTIICAINRSIQVLIGLKYIKPHPVSKVHIPAPLSILWSRRSNTAFHICACIQSYTRSEKRVKSFLERASLFRSQGFPRVHMATEKKQEEKVLFLSRNKEEKRRRKTRVYSCPVCGPRDPFFPTRYDDAGSPTLAKKEIEQKDSQLGASHKKNI